MTAPADPGTTPFPAGGTPAPAERIAWVDASAGIAGDMLLGALLDAGADLAEVTRAVDAVAAGSVRIGVRDVTRAGTRAAKADVELLVEDPPHRTWSTIRTMLDDAELPDRVRDRARATFARLAEAEGRVHGVPADSIHFHEVGALDSIADVVGVCAALESLRIDRVVAGEVAVGSGRARMAHGDLGIPVPAVVELSQGWPVRAGGRGELTTPTGMALLAALGVPGDLPRLVVESAGVGAGSKDVPDRANVTRVVIGTAAGASASAGPGTAGAAGSAAGLDQADGLEELVQVESNVDDLDPRLWPGVLDRLLAAGVRDAWLTPVLMKKGRPAQVVAVLCGPAEAAAVRALLFAETTTLGVRQFPVRREALDRDWRDVTVGEQPVAVKVGHRDGLIVQATPEFAAVAEVAERTGQPVRAVLSAAQAAAVEAGLAVGGSWPTPR